MRAEKAIDIKGTLGRGVKPSATKVDIKTDYKEGPDTRTRIRTVTLSDGRKEIYKDVRLKERPE